jgi:Polyribonucleotide nucleotidyltransferase (polynucleotide phosphorylase)
MYFHRKSLSCLLALAASLHLSTDSQHHHGKALAFSVGSVPQSAASNNQLPSIRTKFTNRHRQSNQPPFLFLSQESSSRLFVDANSASEAIESSLDDSLLEEITEGEGDSLHLSGDVNVDVDGVNSNSDKGDANLDDAIVDDEPLVLCDVPPASHSIQVTNDGPAGSPVTTLTVHLGMPGHPEPLIFQTGKIGRQAAGAVTLTRGDTILYTTASRDKDPKETIDFLPLSVEHQERFSSAGMTSGSYNRRDGRPAEHEVLTCRLIDRPLRPLIADGWRHETQLLSWVLSYDGERSCDPLAITASSAALWISDVPLLKPVAAAMVGYIDGQFVLNPTNRQMEKSKLNLTVAGTKDAVLMIEGAADFLPEEIMIEAVSFGHEAIKTICVALEEFGAAVGKEKNYSTLIKPIEGLQEEVNEALSDKVESLWSTEGGKKEDLSANMSVLSKEAWSMFEEKYPEQKNEVMKCYKNLLSRKLYEKAKKEGIRCDGRRLDEIRNIDIEASILPKVHGSALFTRGETQAIATATLGDSGMKQKIDRLDGMEKKRFYLQYSFPPSCVGETGRVGAPGRREIGHGNLAER